RALAEAEKALAQDGQCAMAYQARGHARYNNKDYDGAIADYNEAIRLDPTFAMAYNNRGLARSDKGDLDGEITDYTEAIRLNPKYAKAYYNRGLARSDKGDLDGAIADYSEAIRLDPRYALAYNNRGVARSNKGDKDGAITDYNEAIRLDPKFALAYHNRGLAREAKEDYVGAITDYTEAISLDPSQARFYLDRGDSRGQTGDYFAALADYTEAIRLNPRFDWAYYRRGLLHRVRGRLREAKQDFAEASRLDRDNPDYRKVLEHSNRDSRSGLHEMAEATDQHFDKILRSVLDRSNEKLVRKWDCGLLWARTESDKRRPDASGYRSRTGRHGTGYVCITDQALYIVTIGALTRKFPTYSGGGMAGAILGFMARDVDEVRPETTDQQWRVPWDALAGAQVSTDPRKGESFVQVLSGPNWEIYPLKPDALDDIVTFLNRGRAGTLIMKLETLAPPPAPAPAQSPPPPAQVQAPAEDIFGKIRKLAELHRTGDISDAEFEAKKKELLDRL
ncbi:MAG: tetratricopeptide repeat protein, partial [Phototrophicaceae bacterium]